MAEEQIVYSGRPSAALMVGTFVVTTLIEVGLVVGMILSRVEISAHHLWPWMAAIFMVPSLWLAGRYGTLKSKLYEVTSERIRVTEGIVSKRTDELELYRVKDATLLEPFLLRTFGAGTIEITSSDASTPVFQMKGIQSAKEVREKLRTCIEACRDRKRTRLTELE